MGEKNHLEEKKRYIIYVHCFIEQRRADEEEMSQEEILEKDMTEQERGRKGEHE